jgi:Flp pilus assembly protein TadD
VRFSQATRLACACALVFSSLTPLRAAGFSNDTRAALMRAPLSNVEAEARVESAAAEGATAGEAQAATPAAKKRPNLFVRIITAPFRGLAKLFGGGDNKGDQTARAKAKQKKDAQTTAANQPPPARRNAPAATAAARTEPMPVAPAAASPLPVVAAAATTPSPVGAATSQPEALAEAAARSVRAGEKALSVPPTFAATTPTATTPPAAAPQPPAPAADTVDYEPRRFTPFIEGVPGDPLSQGRALLANGYTNEAVAELSVAAVTGPDLVEANNLLGLAYDRRGQHKQAREFYERALSVAPRNAQVLNNLGHSLYLDDRYNDALARLKDAARLDPADTRVANNLALVYGRLNKFDDAFKQFKRAGGEFYARTSTAALLATAGRDREAIRHYEAARKLNPVAPDVLRQLITLYVRTGQRDKAEAAQRALDKTADKASAES